MKHTLEIQYGKKLPTSYLNYLKTDDVLEVIVQEYPDVDKYENRYWTLISAKELLEDFNMNDVGKSKNFECLKLYLKVFKEFSDSDYTDSNFGNIPFIRIENSFVFAEENGDYLYFDPEDNYSVWIYYHDGGDVMKVAESFTEVLAFQ